MIFRLCTIFGILTTACGFPATTAKHNGIENVSIIQLSIYNSLNKDVSEKLSQLDTLSKVYKSKDNASVVIVDGNNINFNQSKFMNYTNDMLSSLVELLSIIKPNIESTNSAKAIKRNECINEVVENLAELISPRNSVSEVEKVVQTTVVALQNNTEINETEKKSVEISTTPLTSSSLSTKTPDAVITTTIPTATSEASVSPQSLPTKTISKPTSPSTEPNLHTSAAISPTTTTVFPTTYSVPVSTTSSIPTNLVTSFSTASILNSSEITSPSTTTISSTISYTPTINSTFSTPDNNTTVPADILSSTEIISSVKTTLPNTPNITVPIQTTAFTPFPVTSSESTTSTLQSSSDTTTVTPQPLATEKADKISSTEITNATSSEEKSTTIVSTTRVTRSPEPTKTTINWLKWCQTQCRLGTGGTACECDIIP